MTTCQCRAGHCLTVLELFNTLIRTERISSVQYSMILEGSYVSNNHEWMSRASNTTCYFYIVILHEWLG